MPDRITPARTSRLCLAIFVLALLTHAWLVTRNWTAGFMPGHEFRQAQTAIISDYIDRQNNFSLLYETPILGKPWVSLLLEVPVYQWSVVGLSRLAGVPHYEAARAVSVSCFYLTLPAIFLLLGCMGVPGAYRYLCLALVLTCPVYIFYSRAFLIDSMELMCSAWFLFGYVRMMERRRWYWFLLATVAGTGAALIKSATLAIWLLPAAAYAGWMLWRDLRARRVGAALETIFWGLAGVTVPLGLLQLWMSVADSIKEVHASAWIFTSKNLSQGNWGLTDLRARFSGQLWGILCDRWREAIMQPWLVGVFLAAALTLARGHRKRIAAVASVFFLAQILFPYAYAYQDYYFYACAVFLVVAFGLALQPLWESRAPRWVGGLVLAALFAAELNTYRQDYYPQQMVQSNGGFAFTEALRDFIPRESPIIVVGADWAAMIPLYSRHRALMVRNGLENDRAYLTRAFADLAEEDVGALVLVHNQRGNRNVIDLAAETFQLEKVATFTSPEAEVYVQNRYVQAVKEGLKQRAYYGGNITVDTQRPIPPPLRGDIRVTPALARSVLPEISPAPIRANFTFGVGHYIVEGKSALSAHPDSDVWIPAPFTATSIEWDYGLVADAYQRDGDRSDGVEFVIEGIHGSQTREIFRRKLDPVANQTDRGCQRLRLPYQPLPGEILHFSSRPGDSRAYDWAYWVKIDVQ